MPRPGYPPKRCSHHSIDSLLWQSCEEYVPLLRGASHQRHVYYPRNVKCSQRDDVDLCVSQERGRGNLPFKQSNTSLRSEKGDQS
jgi:hypothetical protein